MAERGASENTRAAYERDLTDFTDWLAKQGQSLIAAESGDIRDFLSALAERGLARSSAARKLDFTSVLQVSARRRLPRRRPDSCHRQPAQPKKPPKGPERSRGRPPADGGAAL